MKEIRLPRIAENEDGTFGVLCDGYVPFALTLEPKWEFNQPFISCIPAGEYICVKIHSPTFGDTYEITDVSGRSQILFHKITGVKGTKGCIGVGEQFEPYGEYKTALMKGTKGFNELMKRVEGELKFRLIIKSYVWR